MHDPTIDYEKVLEHIERFEKLINNHDPSRETIKHYQLFLDEVASHYEYEDSTTRLYSALFELQALIYRNNGNGEAASRFIEEAVAASSGHGGLISLTARSWYHELRDADKLSSVSEGVRKVVGGKRLKRSRLVLGIIGGVVCVLIAFSGVIADDITIMNANPAMVALAQAAGMTHEGELMFLRTNPQLVDDTELAQDCSSAPNNQNGFIEQGCYVPSENDPTMGRIYIRKMPSNLYNLEVTTAAYEMLHPVYLMLINDNDNGGMLNKSIESNYSSLNDADLKAQVDNFAKTEPGARDLELFSILGTEYGDISTDLANYYSPYITDLNTDVFLNDKVNQLFKDDESQLTSLQNEINQMKANADTAYNDSVSWANAGNQYEDNYNYNIYSQDIDSANSYINQYNTLLSQYDLLVSEYNGQQFNSATPIQPDQ